MVQLTDVMLKVGALFIEKLNKNEHHYLNEIIEYRIHSVIFIILRCLKLNKYCRVKVNKQHSEPGKTKTCATSRFKNEKYLLFQFNGCFVWNWT